MRCSQRRSVPTVFHVEDDPIVADAISHFLSLCPEVRHVGFATSGCDGLAFCREKAPEIVLLDLRLPDVDGFAVVDRLNEFKRPPRILLLSCRTDEMTLYRAWSGSVAGLIWKSHNCVERLRDAFAAIAVGQRYFPPDVRDAMRIFRGSPTAFFKVLSPLKIDLLIRFGRGDTPERIAAETGRHTATVEWHLYEIMSALGLHSMGDLRRWMGATGFAVQIRAAPPARSLR